MRRGIGPSGAPAAPPAAPTVQSLRLDQRNFLRFLELPEGVAGGAAWVSDFGHAGGSVRAYRNAYGIPPDSVTGHAEGVTVEMERDAYRGEAVFVRPGPFDELAVTGSFLRYDHREIEPEGGIGTAYGQNSGTAEVIARHGAAGPFDRGGFGVRGQWQGYISDNGRAVVSSDEVIASLLKSSS